MIAKYAMYYTVFVSLAQAKMIAFQRSLTEVSIWFFLINSYKITYRRSMRYRKFHIRRQPLEAVRSSTNPQVSPSIFHSEKICYFLLIFIKFYTKQVLLWKERMLIYIKSCTNKINCVWGYKIVVFRKIKKVFLFKHFYWFYIVLTLYKFKVQIRYFWYIIINKIISFLYNRIL